MIIINYEDAFPTNDGFRTEGVGLMCSSNHPLQWVSMTRHGSLKDFLDVFWSPPSAHRTGDEFVPRAFPGISFLFYESARDWFFCCWRTSSSSEGCVTVCVRYVVRETAEQRSWDRGHCADLPVLE